KGPKIASTDKLEVTNFGFYRTGEGGAPMATAVYRNGQSLFARWDMTGYKYGEGNKVNLSWTVAILMGQATVHTIPAAADQSDGAFYAKPYVDGDLEVPLNKVPAGAYTLLITVKDLAGKQTIESRHNFTVQ
ncbi:MAG TPA: hypothetical protein VMU19_10605, partial [Bryobacteraceae bacterium]|nr:hypothetical protein [Bryobacteraceae bacterium]